MSVVMTRENLIPRSVPVKSADKNPDYMVALIPLYDMINHRAGMITTSYDVQEQNLALISPNDFEAGEQLFMHYGKRSNAEMLLHNGFVDINNKHDYVPLQLGLGQADPLKVKRALLLELALPGVSKNDYELNVLPAPDYFAPQLLAFVRIFNMNEEQLVHWIDSDRAQDLKHIDCALETELEKKTWQYLQTRLMLNLRCFATTLQADEQRLEQLKKGELTLPKIDQNILQYLVLEKRILTGALEHAKQRIKA